MKVVLSLVLALAMLASSLPAMAAEKKPDQWDLTAIYADEAAFQADIIRVRDELAPALAAFEGMLSSPRNVRDCFVVRDELYAALQKMGAYTQGMLDLNHADGAAIEQSGQYSAIATSASDAMAFISPELLGIRVSG